MGVPRVTPGSAPSSPPCLLPEEEQTSPAPTFRREEAAPPAVPAVAAAAAAPYAQRQQERHQAQPPRQHPRRLSRRRAAAAAYRPRRPRLRLSAGVRRCLPRCLAVAAGCASGAAAAAAALTHRLRCPPPRRSLAGNSSTHWRGPGAAPALTPGRPVTSRREGGGSCIFMRRGHRRGVARSPASRLRPPTFLSHPPMPLARVIQLGQAPAPGG